MELSLHPVDNGAVVLVCQTVDSPLNSLNIWVRHPEQFGPCHLMEHVIASTLKSQFQSMHPCALNASTDAKAMSFFCRTSVEAAGPFFETWRVAVDDLVAGDTTEAVVTREIRVIQTEMRGRDRSPSGSLTQALGRPLLCDQWEGKAGHLARIAHKTVVGENVVVLLLGRISEANIDAAKKSLSGLPRGAKESGPAVASPQYKIFCDVAQGVCGTSFSISSSLRASDYSAMMFATRLFVGRSEVSLSKKLREAGLAYKLDRSMMLTGGRGVHTIMVESSPDRTAEVAYVMAAFFRSTPAGLYADLAAHCMAEVRVYLALAQENKGVLASRIGKHFLNYGRLPAADFMTCPFGETSPEAMRDFILKSYFCKTIEVVFL